MHHETANNLEQISSEMWLAKEIHHLGGWQLRFNDGITWRANSVLPISPPSLDLEEAICYCVDYYQARGQPACFQITPYSEPRELNDYLDQQEWTTGIKVDTQTRSIVDYKKRFKAHQVELLDEPDPSWMECFFASSHRERATATQRISLMTRSKMPRKFAQIRYGNEVVSVGLGMVSHGWLGLFRIGTLAEHRQEGLASSLSDALLEWAAVQHKARIAFLQVEIDNVQAKNMYAKLGFEHCYTYWYRHSK